jgi:hypothetical protein
MSINGKAEPAEAAATPTAPDTVPMSEVQAVVGELTWQRNMMADRAANLAVQLSYAQKELAELRAAQPKPMDETGERPVVVN